MTRWIALLRGVNVGGHRLLRMKELVTLLEHDGFEQVRSYVQSGNLVFRAARGGARAHADRVQRCVSERYGFAPEVLVLSGRALARAVAANPFAAAARAPQAVHLLFLAAAPRAPDLAALRALATHGDRFALTGKLCYLHTPRGLGVSKLAARAERLLGVAATARNWRTVTALLGMLRDAA